MADGELFADRTVNFEALRMAVANIEGIRSAERGDLICLIEKIEVKTIRDGKCHLTRQELFEALHWSKNTFDRRRKLAEQLGWISVIRYPQSRGGQGANKWQVNWIRIRNDAQKPSIHLTKKLGNRIPREGNRIPREGNRIPREGNRVEDARARHPINNPNNNPIQHGAGHGNGVQKNASGGWGKAIQPAELTQPPKLQERYEEAITKGWVVRSEINRIQFFALARYAARKPDVQNRAAYFTALLKRGSSPDIPAEEWARAVIKELDRAGVSAPIAASVSFAAIGGSQTPCNEQVNNFWQWHQQRRNE